MESLFPDPELLPVPAGDARLTGLYVEPGDRGGQIRITLELTPCRIPPIVELSLWGSDGHCASSVSIVEPPGSKVELTLHIRRPDPDGSYRLLAALSFPQLGEVDRRETALTLPPLLR